MAGRRIQASASPRAVVLVIGLLGLDPAVGQPCVPLPNGGAMWLLRGGLVVVLHFANDEARWHLYDAPGEESS